MKLRAMALALALLAFNVDAAKAVLNWTPPTRNTDGSALTNLAGYKLLYRKKPSLTWTVKKISNPGLRTVTLWGLAPGTWQFCMKSYNNVGVVSTCTKIVQATLV